METPPMFEAGRRRTEIRDAAIAALVEYAEERVDVLLRGENVGGPASLVGGPEGGPVTEGALARVLTTLGVYDPRLQGPPDPPQDGDDPELEGVYTAQAPNGLLLRLERLKSDDGHPWIDLRADVRDRGV